MVHSRTVNITLDGNGHYLGNEKGCFVVKDRNREVVEKHPLFESEIGEVILKSGNCVSTGVLASMGFWNIDCMVITNRGRPVAMLRSFDDDSHVETRLYQYEAYKNTGKAIGIMKQIVKAKIEGQNQILRKYGLRNHAFLEDRIDEIECDNLILARRKLMHIEGKCSTHYFNQVFQLLPFRPENKKGYNAFDGVNNIFNLAYEVLAWKVHTALLKAKLEPFLGFLHTLKHGTPSLTCDFQELYRYLMDDFVIQYCQQLKRTDFVLKWENVSSNRKAKREYLSDSLTKELTLKLNEYFKMIVGVPRIMRGEKQELETLINEEALLFASFLRTERAIWIPRTAILTLHEL
jgi:CRISPR-associated protein Cas1